MSTTATAPRKTAPAAAKGTTPKAPTAAKAAPVRSACRCGCKATGPGAYRPGHDARHAGQVGRFLLTGPTPAEAKTALAALPTDALRDKARGMAKTAAAKDAKRQARKDAVAAAKAAYKAALAS